MSGERALRERPRSVSVVLPVLDAAQSIVQQLGALAAQDYEGDWELIVVDNGSTDGSRELAAEQLAAQASGRIVDASGRRGASHARNAGARVARGEFLAFCDADDLVSLGWLRELADAARCGDLVAGRFDVERLNEPVVRAWHDAPPLDHPLHGLDFLPFASGGNCGLWAAVFWQLGGFDEELAAGEDIDLSWRAQLAGYRLAFAPDALVHQRFQHRLRALAAQHFLWGQVTPTLFRDFRAVGMPRPGVLRVALEWSWILTTWPLNLWSSRWRGRWVRETALRAGRACGSLTARVVYL